MDRGSRLRGSSDSIGVSVIEIQSSHPLECDSQQRKLIIESHCEKTDNAYGSAFQHTKTEHLLDEAGELSLESAEPG
jgi:hypothetical protein